MYELSSINNSSSMSFLILLNYFVHKCFVNASDQMSKIRFNFWNDYWKVSQQTMKSIDIRLYLQIISSRRTIYIQGTMVKDLCVMNYENMNGFQMKVNSPPNIPSGRSLVFIQNLVTIYIEAMMLYKPYDVHTRRGLPKTYGKKIQGTRPKNLLLLLLSWITRKMSKVVC